MRKAVFCVCVAAAAACGLRAQDAAGTFGRFRFDDGSTPVRVYYDARKPVFDGDSNEVAIVLIHGWGGHVRTLLPAFNRALAARAGGDDRAPYVIAPMFPRRETLAKNGEPDDGRAVWNERGAVENGKDLLPWDPSDDWRGGGDATGTTFSSFDYIDRIFAVFGDRTRYPNLRRVILAGFSAGGQFAGRYAATGKAFVREGVSVEYIAMAPSTELRLDDQPWLYGLRDRPRYSAALGRDEILANLKSRRVWRGCGSDDVLGRPQTSLDVAPAAIVQGANRYERFRSFARYLDAYPDWKSRVSFHSFTGLGHKEDFAYADTALLDFVFGVPPSDWRLALPRPVFDERPELAALYRKAWEIAHTRIDNLPGIPVPRYMDEGHRSDWIWIWDTCFMAHFCKYAPWEFPGIDSLGNFYGILMPDGVFTLPKVRGNRWSCGPAGVSDPWEGRMLDFKVHLPEDPPLFAWTEYRHALQTGDRARLEKVYREKRWLQRWFDVFENFDPSKPAMFGATLPVAAQKVGDLGYRWSGGSSGMDNTPRGRVGDRDEGPNSPADCPNNPDLLWVDAYAQQALAALSILRIADLLGDADGAAEWRAKYEAKKAKVNELYWDEADGFYYDILASDLSKCKVPTMASYWTLLAEIPDAARRARMVEKLKDPNWFGGAIPTPSLARKDADFWPTGGYWRGGVWMPTTYMALKALDGCGEAALARNIARKVVFDMYETWKACEPHTIWEAYSPTEAKPATYAKKKGVTARPDFCGWSALGPISLFVEDVIGVKEANAFTNTLVCDFDRNPKGRVGIENYRFGDIVCSVVATKERIFVESNRAFTLVADGRTFPVGAGATVLRRTYDLADELSRLGDAGGRVVVPAGAYETKPFALKSNVTLELSEGAVLFASTNIADYAVQEGGRCFIFAGGATNVAIVGKGTIDGRGRAFKEREDLAGESQPQALPVMMRFSRCRDLRLEGFTYRDCGAWGCHLRNCDGVTVRRVTCFNHVNNTNDGIDIESSNVVVEDCDIDSDDDAVVFKTESDKSFPVTNVVVRNCRLASCCSALKFGTGSYCDFRDIRIENCRFDRPKGNFRFDWKRAYADRGVREDLTGLSGMSLEVVDGGRMENVTIRNIDLAGYIVPIFIRLARRHEATDPRGSYLRNVLIENVKGACATSRSGCSITGVPGLRPADITLRNVSLDFPGGGTEAERDPDVPELEREYPEGVMFGRNLPAWAFYLRHADRVTFDDVSFTLAGEDRREMSVQDDCREIFWKNRGL